MIDGSIGPRLENFDVSSEVAVNVSLVNELRSNES